MPQSNKKQPDNEILVPFPVQKSNHWFDQLAFFLGNLFSGETARVCKRCNIKMQKVCYRDEEGEIRRKVYMWGMGAEIGMHIRKWQRCPTCGNKVCLETTD